MSRIRLLRTTSFRLATIYLALFTASALALGAFVYLSIRHEILADFDERIVEETDALRTAFAQDGRERLAQMIEARGASGGGFSYGLEGSDGKLVAGDLRPPADGAGGWMEAREAESDEPPEAKSEIVRALATRLSDGSTLVVGDERHRSDAILRGVLSAFGWAVAATLALGTLGGLWLSAQFLGRIDSMRLTAQRLMAGDWSRRNPALPGRRRSHRARAHLQPPVRPHREASHRQQAGQRRHRPRLAQAACKHAAPPRRRARRRRFAGFGHRRHRSGDFGNRRRARYLQRAAAHRPGRGRRAPSGLPPARSRRGRARSRRAFQPAAEEEGKTLLARLDAPLPMAGDKELLVQMIANLLDNALRHTPQGAGVEVSGKRTPGGVSLTVADDGAGVAPDELKSIFRRFYRAEAARASTGTGLGLSLVAAIADLHGLECAASDNRPGLRVTLTTADDAE